MTKILFKLLSVGVLILIGFFIYQHHFGSSVTNADLIHGSRQIGKKVIQFGKEVVDSVTTDYNDNNISSVEAKDYQIDRIPEPIDETVVDENWPEYELQSELSTTEKRVSTVEEIMAKYRAFNVLLEEGK